ncbi:hypothetical protein DM860_016245 [Cuscuta australis]|uniref:Uncharacterized protein n=2 Tax=Cuscuta sect. Cleistogrammica TaxID=1824901 RepID=A0A328E646_9ASTE|nr:hypothetical protein DM860_016245 [Cuscuta australis]
MVPAERTTQDQNGGTNIHVSMDLGITESKSIRQLGHLHEHALKVRKPYTITKQRERWTEEEHNKFLEALKLYGRAWRRIEDHVGTKTAVQIRSHAQKFFSKVARETEGSDGISSNPIEIPPPRPKRKPLHPYPRKQVTPVAGPTLEKRETQSPASVLSPLSSEGEEMTNSGLNGSSPHPVSPALGEESSCLVIPSEQCNLAVEGSRSSSSHVHVDTKPSPNEQPFVSLELFPQENGFIDDSSTEASSTHSLKLFGRTVLVTDSHKPSSPTSGASEVLLPTEEVDEDKLTSQTLPWGFIPVKLMLGTPDSLYYPSLPWALPYAAVSFSSSSAQQVHGPIPIKPQPVFENKDREEDQENHMEVSSSSSRSFETSKMKLSASSTRRKNGFLPYKRCLTERTNHGPGEEREEHPTRLCL